MTSDITITIRPDTGTQRNTIVNLAAAIMTAKADYCAMVAEQFEAKGETITATGWRLRETAIRSAVAVMDDMAGCWS